jgi:two-component system, chemotaxis family, protein-glutamate methylesterase/glutaminase
MSTPAQRPGGRGIRVLAVDDSAVMRGILRMVFDRSPGIEVVATASNGAEGLVDFDRVHPDLVLLDVEMPEMNGLDALSAIRRRDRRVPVIMCSTLTSRNAQITLDALLRGATDYVTKPAAQSGVREGVETLARELVPKILALFAQPRAVVAEPPVAPPLPPSALGARGWWLSAYPRGDRPRLRNCFPRCLDRSPCRC